MIVWDLALHTQGAIPPAKPSSKLQNAISLNQISMRIYWSGQLYTSFTNMFKYLVTHKNYTFLRCKMYLKYLVEMIYFI